MPDYQRGDTIEVLVLSHARYGLIVQTPSGERGCVDSTYISDGTPAQPNRWPAVGSVLTAVVLDQRADGYEGYRWWLSTKLSGATDA